MKNKILITSIFLLISLNYFSVIALLGDSSCDPSIKIINQDPIPAIPDSYVKVIFEISNLYNCNGFAIKLDPEYPFSLDPGYDPIQTIEKNPSVAEYKNVWDVPYKVRVASDALEGEYYLKLLVHDGNSRDFNTYSIERKFNLSIIDAQTDFAAVLQESTGTQISIGLVNTGKNTANSMIVSIPTQDGFRTFGISQQIIGNLAAGDYNIVSFSVSQTNSRNSTSPRNPDSNNLQNTDRTLKINIDYTDAIGKRRSVIKEIPISASQTNSTQTFTNFNRNRTAMSSTNSISIWWYIGIVIVILVILFFIYKKYGHKIFKKNYSKKNSENTPDWVLSQRIHHKK